MTMTENRQVKVSKPWLFKPGVSGNKGGRPKAITAVRDIARQATPKAVRTLVKIMENENAMDSARVAAARELLDRAWGKPTQAVDVDIKIDVAKTLADALDSLSRKMDDGSIIDVTPVEHDPVYSDDE